MTLKSVMRLLANITFSDARVMAQIARIESGKYDEKIDYNNDDKNIYIVGCPTYGNLGDHAIALAENRFITNILGCRPVMLYGPLKRHWSYLEDNLRPNDIICFQGGGNMGSLYPDLENERLALINRFTTNKIVIFPQTISYGSSMFDRAYLRQMKKVYNSHPNLYIVARERMSFNRMNKLFSGANILLTPDIVLSFDPNAFRFNASRKGIALCMRSDKERSIGHEGIIALQKISESCFGSYESIDTVLPCDSLTPREGEQAVLAKIEEISSYELVVTDRIHGMILCALSGTPCIAMDNSNGKVGQEYTWLKALPYMRFAGSAEEAAVMVADGVLQPGDFPFEKFAPLFEPIAALLC